MRQRSFVLARYAVVEHEHLFLKAIGANPGDLSTRLVYADWLEERGDFRAELVRLQVQLATTATGSAEHAEYKLREQELRSRCDQYWLTLLDPPVWCVVGNIVAEHGFGPGGEEVRRGTRLFRPNAKVYLAETHDTTSFLSVDARSDVSIQVIGQHRKSRQWIQSWVRARYTGNWRVRLIHHPGAMIRLREAQWPGFLLRQDEWICSGDASSQATIQALLEMLWTATVAPWVVLEWAKACFGVGSRGQCRECSSMYRGRRGPWLKSGSGFSAAP
jgi:uncharacterized protein (TIGR02996 family)